MLTSTFLIITLLATFCASEKILVCYYGSWAYYRNGNGKCTVQMLDPFVCTHFVYTFVGINEDAKIWIMDPWLELPDNYGKDNFAAFNKLKQSNPQLKTLVAVGGWNEGSAKFSKVANDPTLRVKFAQNAADFALKYGFDGLDMDWEYPGQRDSPNLSTDKEAFSLLLLELRKEFDKKKLLLTAAVAAPRSSASISYDIQTISKHLDFINIMTYDFHGDWDKVTGYNAPLKGKNDNLNVQDAVDYWISEGVPAEKLILGMPLYGRSFRLSNPAENSVGSPSSGAGIAGQYTMQNGFIGYNELCEKNLTDSWPEVWNNDLASVPYTYKNYDWISYENARSILAKTEYLMSMNLGGAMTWSIETDDFNNICGDGRFPLVNTIKDGIMMFTNVTRTEASTSPTSISSDAWTSTRTSVFDSTSISTSASSSTTTADTEGSPCKTTGLVRDVYDCNKFHSCIKNLDGSFISYQFSCPVGLIFDEVLLICNYPHLVDCN